MRSTNSAPLALSNSYFTGSPPVGTSMMTLRVCGGFSPTGIKSIRISDLAWLAPRPVSAGLQQLVEASLSRGRLHEVRIAKPAMIVDGDFAEAIAALEEQLDRVLRALGVLDCLLQSIAGIAAAVH